MTNTTVRLADSLAQMLRYATPDDDGRITASHPDGTTMVFSRGDDGVLSMTMTGPRAHQHIIAIDEEPRA